MAEPAKRPDDAEALNLEVRRRSYFAITGPRSSATGPPVEPGIPGHDFGGADRRRGNRMIGEVRFLIKPCEGAAEAVNGDIGAAHGGSNYDRHPHPISEFRPQFAALHPHNNQGSLRIFWGRLVRMVLCGDG